MPPTPPRPWDTEIAVALAGHEDFRVRAEAGVALATGRNLAPVADVLVRLLLDPGNTLVTAETADALISRANEGALRLLCVALSRANDQQTNWIYDSVLYQDSIVFDPEVQLAVVSLLARLSEDADSDVARQAETLITLVHGEHGWRPASD